MVSTPPPPAEPQIITRLTKEGFTKEEIDEIKAVVIEKLGKPGITPDERVAAFRELKNLALTVAARLDAEMVWPHQLDRSVNFSPMDFKKSYSGYNK